VRLERLGKLKRKSTDLISTGTRDPPACSIVPQPSTVPRVPRTKMDLSGNGIMNGHCLCLRAASVSEAAGWAGWAAALNVGMEVARGPV
jgi:hypothetical protein